MQRSNSLCQFSHWQLTADCWRKLTKWSTFQLIWRVCVCACVLVFLHWFLSLDIADPRLENLAYLCLHRSIRVIFVDNDRDLCACGVAVFEFWQVVVTSACDGIISSFYYEEQLKWFPSGLMYRGTDKIHPEVWGIDWGQRSFDPADACM